MALYGKVGTSRNCTLELLMEPGVVSVEGSSLVWTDATTELVNGRTREFIQAWLVTPL